MLRVRLVRKLSGQGCAKSGAKVQPQMYMCDKNNGFVYWVWVAASLNVKEAEVCTRDPSKLHAGHFR